jgi:hypothetical protein
MTDLNDLKLDKWQGSFEPEPNRRVWLVGVGLAVLVAIGAAVYFLVWRKPSTAPADVRAATEQAVAPTAPVRPLPEAGETIDLPPVDQTDAIVRELVSQLSSHPTVAAWLTTDQLIRNFTVVVDNLSTGRTPSGHLGKIRPTGSFQVREDRNGLWIDPRSYQRYDKYGDAIAALDARGSARLYATLKPRIEDAYRELGHPDGNIDPAVERALIDLLKTPVIDGEVALASRTVAYEFADPRLQSLSSAQRQLLRMGPRNVRLVQSKLREIAPLIGIPVESLPR